jgi:N-acetylneuraminate synthase
MPAYKLASADLTNHGLLAAMARTGKVLICSTGMSSQSEIEDAVALLRRHGTPFVLLHCNSTYPAPFKDINLAYMDALGRMADGMVGYSGHERGYHVPVAAVARGAKVIEKHFTVDRGMEGNDHRVSLLPAEFKAMVDAIREVEVALGTDRPRVITQGEMMNREVLAKSLVAARPLSGRPDHHGSRSGITQSRAKGLQPYLRPQLIGRPAQRAMQTGDYFFPSDLANGAAKPRPYTFRRPFGVPVRYHDIASLAGQSNLDLVEVHLSYKDMEMDLDATLGDLHLPIDLVVHSPELFAGDHVLDLCAADAAYRQRSIAELQRVVDITRALAPRFRAGGPVPIIVNAGGFSADGPIPAEHRPQLYDRIADSLAELDLDGVEIIPQTMPPYPWHFGGQRFHNLFMTAEDIAGFCQRHGTRICLDVSHSALGGASRPQQLQGIPGAGGTLYAPPAHRRCRGRRWRRTADRRRQHRLADGRRSARRHMPSGELHSGNLARPQGWRLGILDRAGAAGGMVLT